MAQEGRRRPFSNPEVTMSKRSLAVLALVALALPAAAGAATATTWDEARALAEKHDKPILIDFYTDW
jgi:thiol:disulfide interchange protein